MLARRQLFNERSHPWRLKRQHWPPPFLALWRRHFARQRICAAIELLSEL